MKITVFHRLEAAACIWALLRFCIKIAWKFPKKNTTTQIQAAASKRWKAVDVKIVQKQEQKHESFDYSPKISSYLRNKFKKTHEIYRTAETQNLRRQNFRTLIYFVFYSKIVK